MYFKKQNQSIPLYLCLAAGCVLVAIWTWFIDPVINRDGVLYVSSARDFINGNYEQAFDVYRLPFYSMTVAVLSKLTQLPAEAAALSFNAVMRIGGGIAFIRICRKLGADDIQLWLAMLIFVLYPGLNEVQSKIIRDHAYLCFFLWMALFFIRYYISPNNRDLILFAVMGMLASACRAEGAVYLLVVFLGVFLFDRQRSRWRWIKLAACAFIMAVSVYSAVYWLYGGHVHNIWKLPQLLQGKLSISKTGLTAYMEQLDSQWLAALFEKTFHHMLIITAVMKQFYNIIEILTIGFTIMLIAGWYYRPLPAAGHGRPPKAFQACMILIGINISVLVFYALLDSIFNDRYPLSLSLLFMLMLPFAVTAVCSRKCNGDRRWKKPACLAVGALLFVNSVEGLDRFTEKFYLREAGEWISRQTGGRYPAERIYINSKRVAYYAGQPYAKRDHYSYETSSRVTASSRWPHLHFMAIHLEKDSRFGFYRDFYIRTGEKPDKVFENKKGGKVLIYDFRSEQAKNKSPG